MLSEKTKTAILELQTHYSVKRSALIPALHLAQAEMGYLSLEVQDEIAKLFDLDPNEVHAVVTFYDMFYEEPIGKHVLHVCKNVSCMLRGSDQLMERLCQTLNIQPGETTADGQFSVIPSECLAACDLAPMMLVDEKVFGPVDIEKIPELLEQAKQGKGHPSPITIEEISHA